MTRTIARSGGRIIALLALLALAACSSAPEGPPQLTGPVAEPGTFENMGPAGMEAVEAVRAEIAPTDEELVIYYVRPDANYEPWGVWLWAFGSGDGADNWPYTQDLEELNGVGYLKVRLDGSDIGASPVGDTNEIGFIIRQDSDWIKDTPADRIWNLEIGNEIVVFSGDATNYAPGPYVPFFREAILKSPTELDVTLSGRQGLTVDPSDNGFSVQDANGRTYPIADVVNQLGRGERFQNYANRITITLEEEVEVGPQITLSHPEYLAPIAVSAAGLVAAYADRTIPAPDYALGAIYNDGGVEFRVWSPFARSVTARIYTATFQPAPEFEVPLVLNESTGVWSGTFNEVDPNGLFYDYLINQGGIERAALDPYAMSMDAYRDEGGNGRGAIVDLRDERAQPIGGWQGLEDVDLGPRTDAIIYEIHVRDFTISPDAAVEGQPGSYLAFIEKLPYLRDLGVTHVQLLPVLNFYYTDETDVAYEDAGTAGPNNYNWGYDPHSWFTPEGWYATDPTDPYNRIAELKTLIREIHRNEMGVLLDVVYNHYGNTNVLEDVVRNYYFRRNPNGSFTSNSGVGNDFASTRAMARRLIVDSIVHWVREYNIDGFRFDLMGLIDTETILMAHEAASAIPGKEDIFFEGEGWKMYNGPAGTRGMDQDFMTSTDLVAVFNDEVRDLLKAGGFNEEGRGFLTRQRINTETLFKNLIGQPQGNYRADDPGDSMTYIAAHDGLTLHDSISHNARLDPTIPSEKQEIADRARIGNFLVLTGQSIPFLHAGQERLRTKPRLNATSEVIGNYVRNSYDSSDNINQFIWTMDPIEENLYEYTKGLIAIRRAFDAFRIGNQADIDASVTFIEQNLPFGLSYRIDWGGDSWFILANADAEAARFDLGTDLAGAAVHADRRTAGLDVIGSPAGVSISGSEVTLDALTPALIRVEGGAR